MALRNELDLFVNVLECKSYPGIVSRHQNIDIVIVRQNTEGEYAMLEHEVSSNRLNSCLYNFIYTTDVNRVFLALSKA